MITCGSNLDDAHTHNAARQAIYSTSRILWCTYLATINYARLLVLPSIAWPMSLGYMSAWALITLDTGNRYRRVMKGDTLDMRVRKRHHSTIFTNRRSHRKAHKGHCWQSKLCLPNDLQRIRWFNHTGLCRRTLWMTAAIGDVSIDFLMIQAMVCLITIRSFTSRQVELIFESWPPQKLCKQNLEKTRKTKTWRARPFQSLPLGMTWPRKNNNWHLKSIIAGRHNGHVSHLTLDRKWHANHTHTHARDIYIRITPKRAEKDGSAKRKGETVRCLCF